MCSALRFASVGLASTLPVVAQVWTESSAGQLPETAETTIGTGLLTTINGSVDPGEDADLYYVRIEDAAAFTCTSVGGATWDTQLWMFDINGNGISFRDDDAGTLQSTLTGQFLAGQQIVIVGVSRYNSDAQDAGAALIWNNTPFNTERAPDGPGAANRIDSWTGTPNVAGAYTLRLTGASYAQQVDLEEGLHAWAWVNVGTSTFFTPSAAYQHTPSGERIWVTRNATGRFDVSLGAMPINGRLHVTGYGSGTAAVIEYWGLRDGKLVARVNVHDQAGNLVNRSFSIHYRVGGQNDERVAWLWANNPTSASYTPNSLYMFNGNRGPATITRSGTGVYNVSLPGLGLSGQSEGGNVQVTNYAGFGSTTLSRAKVSSWGGSTDLSINVRTFDAAGNPSDERFVLGFNTYAAPIAERLGSGAHVWANSASAAAPYTPSSYYTDSNGLAGPANSELVTKLSTGSYQVNLPNVVPSNSTVAIVTAYGSSSDWASIASWLTLNPTGARVLVNTYDSAGVAKDSQFTLLYLTSDPATFGASNEFIGAGCGGLGLTATTRPSLTDDWQLEVLDVPLTTVAAFVSFGFSNPNLPLDFLGLTGCVLYQDLVQLQAVPVAVPTYSLAIPNNPALIGGALFAQGAALVPGVNPFQGLTSNGVKGTIGTE